MAKVTGFGGVFFKVKDPAATRAWYVEHLGIPADQYGWMFRWKETDEEDGFTLWSPFSADTDYFAPSEAPFMINLRVDDLDGMLAQLRAKGVGQLGETVDESYGRFAWILDPDGIKVELYQPAGEPL